MIDSRDITTGMVYAYESGLKDGRNEVLDEIIEHFEKMIKDGAGTTFNHGVTYEWMYGGLVDYFKCLKNKVEQHI